MGDVLPVSVTVILPTRNEEEALGPTIDAIPQGWCKDLEIMIVDGNSSDRTREIALEKGIRVHLEPRKGYGRAYRTGFDVAKNDIIVTMDADCTYPAELVPSNWSSGCLMTTLISSPATAFPWLKTGPCLAFTALATGCSPLPPGCCSGTASKTHKPACGCSANPFLRTKKCGPPTTGCRSVKKSKSSHVAISERKKPSKSPFHTAPVLVKSEIHTWGDGWKNLKFLFLRRFGLHRTRTPWGGLDTNPKTPTTMTCPNKREWFQHGILAQPVEFAAKTGWHRAEFNDLLVKHWPRSAQPPRRGVGAAVRKNHSIWCGWLNKATPLWA